MKNEIDFVVTFYVLSNLVVPVFSTPINGLIIGENSL